MDREVICVGKQLSAFFRHHEKDLWERIYWLEVRDGDGKKLCESTIAGKLIDA